MPKNNPFYIMFDEVFGYVSYNLSLLFDGCKELY
jgi:hypothetical protein